MLRGNPFSLSSAAQMGGDTAESRHHQAHPLPCTRPRARAALDVLLWWQPPGPTCKASLGPRPRPPQTLCTLLARSQQRWPSLSVPVGAGVPSPPASRPGRPPQPEQATPLLGSSSSTCSVHGPRALRPQQSWLTRRGAGGPSSGGGHPRLHVPQSRAWMRCPQIPTPPAALSPREQSPTLWGASKAAPSSEMGSPPSERCT